MSTKTVFLLVLISLILIFGTQIFLITDYYNTTRTAWTKESNTIIEEAFRGDLTLRNSMFRKAINDTDVVIGPPTSNSDNVSVVDVRLPNVLF